MEPTISTFLKWSGKFNISPVLYWSFWIGNFLWKLKFLCKYFLVFKILSFLMCNSVETYLSAFMNSRAIFVFWPFFFLLPLLKWWHNFSSAKQKELFTFYLRWQITTENSLRPGVWHLKKQPFRHKTVWFIDGVVHKGVYNSFLVASSLTFDI